MASYRELSMSTTEDIHFLRPRGSKIGLLDPTSVTTAEAFNNEMRYREMTFRVCQLSDDCEAPGQWVVYDESTNEPLYAVPRMHEEDAVRIMCAWTYGWHQGNHESFCKRLAGHMRADLMPKDG